MFSGVTGGDPVDTLQGGDTRMNFLKKLWLNLERTVDKRGRTGKKKGHHFADGDD